MDLRTATFLRSRLFAWLTVLSSFANPLPLDSAVSTYESSNFVILLVASVSVVAVYSYTLDLVEQYGSTIRYHRLYSVYLSRRWIPWIRKMFIWAIPLLIAVIHTTAIILGLSLHAPESASFLAIELNPDICGVGVRTAIYISGALVAFIAILGQWHGEVTGAQEVAAGYLLLQLVYTISIFAGRANSPGDMLMAAMMSSLVMDLVMMTFSLKEVLAARLLPRLGIASQVLAQSSIFYASYRAVQTVGCEDFETGQPPVANPCSRSTYWLYFTLRCLSVMHNIWLMMHYMKLYQLAAKQTEIEPTATKSAWHSIPATTFTKYREWVVFFIGDAISIETSIRLFVDSENLGDWGSWGQLFPLLLSAFTFGQVLHRFHTMFKRASAERRRQRFEMLYERGSLMPDLAYVRPKWDKGNVPDILRQVWLNGPFGRLPLYPVDHARRLFYSIDEPWKRVPRQYKQWPGKTAIDLEQMLLEAVKNRDFNYCRDLIAEGAFNTLRSHSTLALEINELSRVEDPYGREQPLYRLLLDIASGNLDFKSISRYCVDPGSSQLQPKAVVDWFETIQQTRATDTSGILRHGRIVLTGRSYYQVMVSW